MNFDRLKAKEEVSRRLARLEVCPEPEGRDRERLVLELIALVQAPYAMTTPESRADIRAVAGRLEGKRL